MLNMDTEKRRTALQAIDRSIDSVCVRKKLSLEIVQINGLIRSTTENFQMYRIESKFCQYHLTKVKRTYLCMYIKFSSFALFHFISFLFQFCIYLYVNIWLVLLLWWDQFRTLLFCFYRFSFYFNLSCSFFLLCTCLFLLRSFADPLNRSRSTTVRWLFTFFFIFM